MIQTLYIEKDILNHPRVEQLCARFAEAEKIVCEHYGEVFNRKAQNFRFQKKNPALILAKKYQGYVLPAPAAYGIGGEKNFYFSHMMNCIYDCRYCFLQGMYRSANYVLFVNYEDTYEEIKRLAAEYSGQSCYFFSGYDCDSLALEPITQFIDNTLPMFAELDNAWLELRTKSTQIRGLLAQPVVENCVVAFSLSPDNIVNALEAKTPSLQKRIEALRKLQDKDWAIGLRFDPLIYSDQYKQDYSTMFEQVFAQLDCEKLHSVSLGSFRMPEKFFKNMVKLYPDEKLFAGAFTENSKQISYSPSLEQEMMSYCEQIILSNIPREKFFPCH